MDRSSRAAPALATLLAAALVAAGCDSGSSGPPASSAASVASSPRGSSASAGPSPSPSGPRLPTVSARVQGSAPVVASDAGPAGHPYALPAASGTAADGTNVLFVVWFAAAPGDQVVTVSTSRDARTWSIGKTPVYRDLGLDFADPGPVPSTALVLPDGSW